MIWEEKHVAELHAGQKQQKDRDPNTRLKKEDSDPDSQSPNSTAYLDFTIHLKSTGSWA